jgi:uracil-DNA glycosylase
MLKLKNEIKKCGICSNLPHGIRPVVQFSSRSRLLIAGQAPGRKVHETGIPFDDPSGDRLRGWLGLDRKTLYDDQQLAIVPMGFCYPGTGKSGDLPPRPECANAWRERVLEELKAVELTIVIGRYALDYHLPSTRGQTVTQIVKQWQEYWPNVIPLPHPSPRNNRWLKNNPWFEAKVLPMLREQVAAVLGG